MRLDERTARRIARGRFATESKDAFSRIDQFKRALSKLPTKRHARIRAMAETVRKLFGRLLFSISIEKRHVSAITLLINEDLSADLSLLFFYPESEPTGIVLAQIANHAVARLMERKLNVDPVDAIRAELNEAAVDSMVQYGLGTHATGQPVPYRTEVKTPTGRFRVSTEVDDDGRVGLKLVTWLRDGVVSSSV